MSHILCSSLMVRKDLSWPVKLFFAKSQSKYGRIYQQRNNNFFCYGGSYVFLAKDFCLSYSAQRISFSLMLCKTWDHSLSKILTPHKTTGKIFTSRKTQTILTPHKTTGKRPNRLEEHLCFLRSRHGKNQFRGHGFMGGGRSRQILQSVTCHGSF